MKKIKITAVVLCVFVLSMMAGCIQDSAPQSPVTADPTQKPADNTVTVLPAQKPDDAEFEKWNLSLDNASVAEIVTASGENKYVKDILEITEGKNCSTYFTAGTVAENNFSPENLTYITLQQIGQGTEEIVLNLFVKNSEKPQGRQELDAVFEEREKYVKEITGKQIRAELVSDTDKAGYYSILRFEDEMYWGYLSASGEKTFCTDSIQAFVDRLPQAATPRPSARPVPEDFPPVNIVAAGNAVKSADIISERLIFCLDTAATPEQPEFSKIQFLCSLVHIQDTDFCYHGIFPLVDNYKTQFKVSNAQRVLYQVFGTEEDMTKVFSDADTYNPDTLSYEFSTDFGWGVMFYYADSMHSRLTPDGKMVITTVQLYAPDSSSGDPGHKLLGWYNIFYDIVTEGEETFLRFVKFEKIP